MNYLGCCFKGEVQTCTFSIFDILKHFYLNNFDYYYKKNNIIRLYTY